MCVWMLSPNRPEVSWVTASRWIYRRLLRRASLPSWEKNGSMPFTIFTLTSRFFQVLTRGSDGNLKPWNGTAPSGLSYVIGSGAVVYVNKKQMDIFSATSSAVGITLALPWQSWYCHGAVYLMEKEKAWVPQTLSQLHAINQKQKIIVSIALLLPCWSALIL